MSERPVQIRNLFSDVSANHSEEQIDILLRTPDVRLERIVSTGQITPDGEWYDQDTAEWVLLLTGMARLRFETPAQEIDLKAGDCLLIPPHCRHRVDWTSPDGPSVWLALHVDAPA